MQARKPTALEREAQVCGIQTSYIDNTGKKQFASEETLRLLLDRLGLGKSESSAPIIEPVLIRWQNANSQFLLRLPARELNDATLKLRLEDGEEESIPLREVAGVSD